MQGESRQQIREGKVTAVYPARHSARVTFPDKADLTSAELPIIIPCAAKNKIYALPDVGDTVVCLMAGNSENVGDGWIIGSRYTDKASPKVNNQDVTRMDFGDGTFVEYNRKTHALQIVCKGEIIIKGENIYLN